VSPHCVARARFEDEDLDARTPPAVGARAAARPCSGARGSGAAGDAFCAQDASQVADLILSECWALLERHRALPADWYNDDGQYKTALLEVAGMKEMAMRKFAWWSEQTYVFIFSLRTKTMTQVNRSHIGSLQAAYQRAKAAGDAHALRGAAEQLLRETGQTHSAGVNEAVGVDGDTALGVAAADGDERSVALLLDAEADTDRCNAAGFSPLVAACCNGHRECARLLLLARADVDRPTVPTPPCATRRPARCKATLYHPARCKATVYPSAKRRKMVHVLLNDARAGRQPRPPQETDVLGGGQADGRTAVFMASEGGHSDCLQLLVAFRADVTQGKPNGTTPLWTAALHGHVRCIEMLASAPPGPPQACRQEASAGQMISAQAAGSTAPSRLGRTSPRCRSVLTRAAAGSLRRRGRRAA